jgi:predicted DNA-binding helix-hairpin-helix protein
MSDLEKLKELSSQSSFELDGETHSSTPPACFSPKERDQAFVHPAQMPNGRRIMLLKTQLSSACERDCFYCPFRSGRDFRRATFPPEDFASLFMKLHERTLAEGIFLSSGIAGGGARTQDKLIDTADILRNKFHFRGYLHLKVMPGAEKDQVLRSMQLADRISVNLEAPNSERLARLAPRKTFFDELIQPLKWIASFRKTQPAEMFWKGHHPSAVTQFVAGGADESDLELLSTTQWLYRSLDLKRAYFSAFNPIRDPPLENKPAVDPLRQHRLHQASFLLRDYGFDLEDLPFNKTGDLPLHSDPKQAWAQTHLMHQPLEINQAGKQELLRIPGIGMRGAERIIRMRKMGMIRELSSLKKLGVITERAAPFILLNGRKPDAQLDFFQQSN